MSNKKLTSSPKSKESRNYNWGDLKADIDNNSYSSKGSKVTIAELESILANPNKGTQAELLVGHNLSNISNTIKLGWQIARNAANKYGGKPIEYVRGGAFKLAGDYIKQVNSLKPTIASISGGKSIINQIVNEYEQTVREQSKTGEISRGIIYQIDRLRQILNNYQIHGKNANQTGFWEWVIDNGTLRSTRTGFFDSGDNTGSENSVDAGPLLGGTQQIINQIDKLVPVYLASLR